MLSLHRLSSSAMNYCFYSILRSGAMCFLVCNKCSEILICKGACSCSVLGICICNCVLDGNFSPFTAYSSFITLILLVLMTFTTGCSIAPVVNTIKLPLSDSVRNLASFLVDATVLTFVATHNLQQGLATKDLHGCCLVF
jgi:hypothetical protein